MKTVIKWMKELKIKSKSNTMKKRAKKRKSKAKNEITKNDRNKFHLIFLFSLLNLFKNSLILTQNSTEE